MNGGCEMERGPIISKEEREIEAAMARIRKEREIEAAEAYWTAMMAQVRLARTTYAITPRGDLIPVGWVETNAPGHGPWIICTACDGDGYSCSPGSPGERCIACGGDGGRYDDPE